MAFNVYGDYTRCLRKRDARDHTYGLRLVDRAATPARLMRYSIERRSHSQNFFLNHAEMNP
jgi:hypothetical protein